jgi:condensation domain-containing protein
MANLVARSRMESTVEWPTSLLQAEMVLAEQSTDSPRENVYGALLLAGPLDAPALESAFAAVVHRHEPLRTRILAGDVPRQRVEPLRPRLPPEDVADVDEAVRIADEMARTRIELETLPLWRVRLLRISPSEHVLAFVFHHIILDGWSLFVFLRDLATAYREASSGGAPDLPPLPLTYGEHCVAERDRLSPDVVEKEIAYWCEQLPRSLPAELPVDRPRAASRGRGAALPAEIEASLADPLAALARRERGTLFHVLLAAVATSLLAAAQAEEIVVGVPLDNRHRRELRELVGYFSNVVPFVVRDGGGAPAERLARAHASSLTALRSPYIPPEMLMRDVYDAVGVPYRVCLNVQAPLGFDYSLPALEMSSLPLNNGTSQLEYYLFLHRSVRGLSGALVYDSDLILEERADALWGSVRGELRRYAAGIDWPGAFSQS